MGWKAILETAKDIEVVDEARSSDEAIQKALELSPDVLLMDLKWFGDRSAGLTAIKKIKASKPEVKIIAITAYEDMIYEARAVGADLAITKDFTREQLLNRIHEIVWGKIASSPTEEHLTSQDLTQRELEILALLALGESDKNIAEKLAISEMTVRNHVRGILEKLDAKNRTHAAQLARQLGLIS
jgi:DNA-binding NarL/FixJ family response regulator